MHVEIPLVVPSSVGSADISLFLPQVIFITEYMSSGSLKQFLKKTKKNHKTMNEKVRRKEGGLGAFWTV